MHRIYNRTKNSIRFFIYEETKRLFVFITIVISIISLLLGLILLLNYFLHKNNLSFMSCLIIFIISGTSLGFLLVYYIITKIITNRKKITIEFNNNNEINNDIKMKNTTRIKYVKFSDIYAIDDDDDDEIIIDNSKNKNDNISLKSDDIMINITSL